MRKDMWFDLYSDEDELRQSQACGAIRLQLQWLYNRTKYFEQALHRVEETLQQETVQMKNVQEHLKNYRYPFKGLLENSEFEADSDIEQDKLELAAGGGSLQARVQMREKHLSKTVDTYAHNLAQRFGARTVPWFSVTQVVLGIYSVLTILTLYFRPDFVNVTSAIYFMIVDHLLDWDLHDC